MSASLTNVSSQQVRGSRFTRIHQPVSWIVWAPPNPLAEVFPCNRANIALQLFYLLSLQPQRVTQICQKAPLCLVNKHEKLPDCNNVDCITVVKSDSEQHKKMIFEAIFKPSLLAEATCTRHTKIQTLEQAQTVQRIHVALLHLQTPFSKIHTVFFSKSM